MTDPRSTGLPERDPALDAAWRAYSVETPPPALDAKILAAAHREARSRPRAPGDDDALAEAREPSRWWWGLAAAATIGAVAFGIVQLAPPSTPTEPMVASDVPQESAKRRTAVPAGALPQASPPAPEISTPDPLPPPSLGATTSPHASIEQAAPARRDGPPSTTVHGKRESERPHVERENDTKDSRERTPVPQPAPAPRDAPAADQAVAPQPFPIAPAAPAELKKTEPDRRQAPAPLSIAPDVPPPQPGAAPAAVMAPTPRAERANEAQRSALGAAAPTATPLPPEEYVARIVALHTAGRLDEAASLLNRFRGAHADADKRLPPDLRAWAATVERRP